jgi:hypothetical protein
VIGRDRDFEALGGAADHALVDRQAAVGRRRGVQVEVAADPAR